MHLALWRRSRRRRCLLGSCLRLLGGRHLEAAVRKVPQCDICLLQAVYGMPGRSEMAWRQAAQACSSSGSCRPVAWTAPAAVLCEERPRRCHGLGSSPGLVTATPIVAWPPARHNLLGTCEKI